MIAINKNLACRTASLIAFALLAVLIWPLGAAEPNAELGVKGRDTPQALLATYRSAIAKKDWQTCYRCYDAKMRAQFLGMLLHDIGMSQDANLAELVEKHRANKFANPEGVVIPNVRSDSRAAKELRGYETLQKQFSDLPGFVDEVCRRFNARGGGPFVDLGDVRNIKIQGNGAVGYWNPAISKQRQQAPAEGQQAVHFCKIDGKWYLTNPDPPPLLSIRERAAQLQAEVETIWVLLCCSVPSFNEPKYGEVRMSVRPFVYKSNKPNLHLIRLSEAQAKKFIEYLATEGFLEKAVEIRKQEVPDRDLSKNCYTLQVSTTNLQGNADLGLALHEDLGWGPGLVKRLEGLRGALDEEGARALDAIIAGLADERKENGGR